MPADKDPLLHLARGLEELLQAAAAGLEAWRERGAPGERKGGDLVALLRAGVRVERARWARRAADDPAARRVRDLCTALLDVLEDDAAPPQRRAPRHRPRERWN